MKRILISILLATSISGFACNINLAKAGIKCNGTALTSRSTLAEVRACQVEEEKFKKDKKLFKVEFTADNGRDYECFFPSSKDTAIIKYCKRD